MCSISIYTGVNGSSSLSDFPDIQRPSLDFMPGTAENNNATETAPPVQQQQHEQKLKQHIQQKLQHHQQLQQENNQQQQQSPKTRGKAENNSTFLSEMSELVTMSLNRTTVRNKEQGSYLLYNVN